MSPVGPVSAAARMPGALLSALGAVVVAVLAAVLAGGPVQGGLAAWGASAQRTSAPVSRAVVGHTFTPRAGGGTGGASYTSSSFLSLPGSAVLVDLVSTSTVPVVLTGTATTDNLLVGSRLTVSGCTLPWQGTTCPGTTWTVLREVTVDAVRPVQWSPAPVPAKGTLHLRVTLSGTVANVVRFTATPVPARAPGDRSAA